MTISNNSRIRMPFLLLEIFPLLMLLFCGSIQYDSNQMKAANIKDEEFVELERKTKHVLIENDLESSLAKFNFTLLEVRRSVCAKLGETIYVHCVPEELNSEQLAGVASLVSHGFWKTELGGILPEGAVEPRRYAVDDQLVLQIQNSKPQDTGILTCTLILRNQVWKTSSVMIAIYDVPKLGLEFPFVLKVNAIYCYDKLDMLEGSLNVLQEMFCGSQQSKGVRRACQYDIGDITCRREPLDNSMNNENHFIEVIIKKLPHPKFRSPHCPDDCMRVYYVQHINSNLEQVVRISQSFHSKLLDFNFMGDLYPTKLLTMRRYFHICMPGFSPRKNCGSPPTTICEPCDPGSYSEAGMDSCEKCPVDTYQEHFGGDSCERCPHGKGSGTLIGLNHNSYCYDVINNNSIHDLLMVLLVLWVVVLLLLGFSGIKLLVDGWCPTDSMNKLIHELEEQIDGKVPSDDVDMEWGSTDRLISGD